MQSLLPTINLALLAGVSIGDLSETQINIAMIITQAVCFGIFMWIMVKYAVGPVKSVLDERRQKIQSEFDRIAELEKKYETLKADYDDKLKHIEDQARQAMQEQINDGRKIANDLTEQARAESREIVERAKRTVELEVDKAKIQLKDHVIAMTMQATEKLLREKLDDTRDKQLVGTIVAAIEKRSAQPNGSADRS